MAEKTSGGLTIPWAALLGVLAAAGPALLYFSPLSSSRPASEAGPAPGSVGFQDVAARLWQDPFKAVTDEGERQSQRDLGAWPAKRFTVDASPIPARPTTRRYEVIPSPRVTTQHDLPGLAQQIADKVQDCKGKQKVLLLPVLTLAAPYAELSEHRHRMRVAVLEALGICGYEPSDGEHIGYVDLCWPWEPVGEPSQAWSKLHSSIEQPVGDHPLRVPYEWCQPATVKMLGTTRPRSPENPENPQYSQYGSVVVLWLSEEGFADAPLTRLAVLLSRLEEKTQDVAEKLDVKLLGPRTSTGLRSIVYEVCHGLSANCRQILRQAVIYSPTSTADDAILLEDLTQVREDDCVSRYVERLTRVSVTNSDVSQADGIRLVRTTLTDRELASGLIDELMLRNVVVRQTGTGARMDHVAVVAEWDTFYGRALPVSFAAAAVSCSNGPSAKLVRQLLRGETHIPAWIHPFVYLRGIDGQTVGVQKAAEAPTPGAPGLKIEAPAEPPEGLNQSDYLRRLASQLAALDLQLREQGGDGLKAVGVLGTDVYDKLLVLRAIRDRLPGTLFFTTGLDARYELPSEWKATHNLVTASAFGLRLHKYYQQNIPPFRDDNQTAVFSSTLTAMDAAAPEAGMTATCDPPKWLGAPRIFEISRSGAWDLTVDSDDSVKPVGHTAELVDGERPDVPPPTVHPPRYDLGKIPQRWGPWYVIIALLAIGFSIPLALGARPEKFKWRQLLRSTRIFLLVTVPLLLVCFLQFVLPHNGKSGEPFALADGVSIWPSELLRVIAGLLCLHFIVKGVIQVCESDQEVQRKFRLKPLPVGTIKPPNAAQGHTPDWFPIGATGIKFRLDGWQVLADDAGVMVSGKPEAELPCTALWLHGKEKPEMGPADTNPPHGEAKVFAQNLWWEYQRRSTLWARLVRASITGAIYFALGYFVISIFGLPRVPGRGPLSFRIDTAVTLWFSVPCWILLTFFVLDAAYLNHRFIRYLVKTTTHYPDGVLADYDWGLESEDLTEYLDIRFIAMRSKIVGDVVYYPFLIFFLMIMARLSLFGDWGWPIGLLVIYAGNLVLATIGALMLRRAAEDARQDAVSKLRARLLKYTASANANDHAKAEVLGKVIKAVENEREGAFSLLSQYPLLASILLPSGSIGLWALVEYLVKTGG